VGGNVSVDSEMLLMTDFVNLKIQLTQSFGCAHRGIVYVYVFIGMRTRTYMSIYVCTVFLKNDFSYLNKLKPQDHDSPTHCPPKYKLHIGTI
jgi:hypothetical protein